MVPTLAAAISCLAICSALGPFCIQNLLDSEPSWTALASAMSGIAVMLAVSAPMMLMHAVATAKVFTHLHKSVPWTPELVKAPTALDRWFAGPAYLTTVPFEEEESQDEGAD